MAITTTSVRKLGIFSHVLFTLNCILIVNLSSLPLGQAHISSIYDGRDVRLGGYIFRVHPKKGEAKHPLLSRESRGPMLHSGDRLDVVRLPYIRHPSYTHKYLSNQRLMKFHNPQPSQYRESDIPSAEASFENFLTKLAESKASGGDGEENSSKESPTFTPYISARALSNMQKFFDHMQENLEALQKNEGEDDGGEVGQMMTEEDGGGNRMENDSNGSPEKSMASTYHLTSSSLPVEWKPRAAGGSFGLKKIRSFFPLNQNQESRSRLGTNLGLGRKR